MSRAGIEPTHDSRAETGSPGILQLLAFYLGILATVFIITYLDVISLTLYDQLSQDTDQIKSFKCKYLLDIIRAMALQVTHLSLTNIFTCGHVSTHMLDSEIRVPRVTL